MPKTEFDNYAGFLDKFKPKLTTDDCYTPPWLYDIVLDYVDNCVRPLAGLNVLRPFWPGADYTALDYADCDVVIDNPPFSIISKICDWYDKRGVPFFLFAPSLTLGGLAKDRYTAVICSSRITYGNGAQVPTSFVSNMYEGNPAIVIDGRLAERIRDGGKRNRKENTVQLPKFELPDGVLSSARLDKIANAGIDLRIERHEAKFIRRLESMGKKAIFGGGWIVSRQAAAREAAAREAAAREAAVAAVAAMRGVETQGVRTGGMYRFPLSDSELKIIDRLSENGIQTQQTS